MTIYEWSTKGLKTSKENLPTDRMLFTGKRTAILYNNSTKELIEPFYQKSKDNLVVASEDPIPTKLTVAPSLRKVYSEANWSDISDFIPLK